jgi:Lon protease-like protein
MELEIKKEIECAICSRIYYEPITMTCGHTFCRNCLLRSMDYSNRCCLCREIFHINVEEQPETTVIKNIIQNIYPNYYKERMIENNEFEDVNNNTIPLFVINIVHFPTTQLILHIFEPRYRLMLRRVLKGSKEFAIIPSINDEMQEFGVITKIKENKLLTDGRSYILTTGTQKIKILETFELDGYKVGKYSKEDDIKCKEDEAFVKEFKEIYDSFQKLCQLNEDLLSSLESQYGKLPNPNEHDSFLYWISSILISDLNIKVEILKLNNIVDRLNLIKNTLKNDEQLKYFFK